MIVADTNLIGYLYLTSGRSVQAEQALRKDPDWAAPLLWRSELRNVLALYVRQGLLALVDAHQVMVEAARLVHGREYEVTSLAVLSLAASSSCSAYDCEFVALAQDLAVSLVTVDRQILSQFPETSISLDAFVSTS
jgi:predicted nucleic acid-binding protein